MEKIKKILMIVSLSSLAAACLMLILAVFQVPIFEGIQLRVLLIVSTIAVSCGLAINEVAVIKRKKILGIVGLSFLAVSVVMALIVFCSNLLVTESVFNRITGIVAIMSVLFIVVISIYSKLGKSMLALQIPTYASMIGFGSIIALLIAGVEVFELTGMVEVFIILIIASVGLLIASAVVSARKKTIAVDREDMITIPKAEYESMKKQIASLQAQLESKDANKTHE